MVQSGSASGACLEDVVVLPHALFVLVTQPGVLGVHV
jgi:hypothetical protein